MKTSFILPERSQQRLVSLLFFTMPLIWLQNAMAQTPVTAVFTHFTNATTATTYTGTGATGNSASGLTGNTYTYEFGTIVAITNNNQILDSFTALSENFHFQAATMNVQFRRVNNTSVTGLRKDMWYECTSSATINAGGTLQLYPDYGDDSLELLFTQRLFNVGIDNVFQNATTTDNNNIERVDVIFPTGVTATDNTKAGFVVFDRGSSGSHDPFYIAAITSLDGSGNPSGYGTAVSVTSAEYGSNVGGNVNYPVLRQNPGDPGLLLMNNVSSQNRDGVLVRFTDLGIASNAKIYGYSLFSTDDVYTPTSNMVDYTNNAYFPTATDLTNGGLDPLAITGLWVTSASYVVLAKSVESFTAADVSDQVRLNWQLGVVDDESTLLVERSTDGASYTTLMEFPRAEPGPQTAIDPQPLDGTNYYRLELVNAAGSVTSYSQICTINNAVAATGSLSVAICPNPVRSRQLMVAAQGLTPGTYVLRLYDLNGTSVLSQDCSGGPAMNQTISLPDGLATGIYSAQLADKHGHAIFIRQVLVE